MRHSHHSRIQAFSLGLLCCFFMTGTGCSARSVGQLDPKHPLQLTVWHYYNGAQEDAFCALTDSFNATTGKELGIHIEECSQGSVENLNQSVLASARKEAGAAPMPDLFAAYPDMAYAADQLGVVADISPYFTEEERAQYVDAYLESGRFSGNETLKLFPIAKSTEVLALNQTDWQKFSSATHTPLSSLDTVEGVTATAKAYYEWTDSLTPDTPYDGSALFGRDAFANYMILGARQLGTELFEVHDGVCTLHFDAAVVRKLWDNYYVPMVAGWFASENRFCSDDIKFGAILAGVCSTSGSAYLPEERIVSDTESYPIQLALRVAPKFAGGENYAVQQGAGMAVTAGTPERVYAAVTFLKWFTQPEQNATFCGTSGYLPVTKEASTSEYLCSHMDAQPDAAILQMLTVALRTTEENTMYAPPAFAGATDARAVLETAMPQKAAEDRAAFLALLKQGVSYEKALASFTTDANFENWYHTTLTQLKAALAG